MDNDKTSNEATGADTPAAESQPAAKPARSRAKKTTSVSDAPRKPQVGDKVRWPDGNVIIVRGVRETKDGVHLLHPVSETWVEASKVEAVTE